MHTPGADEYESHLLKSPYIEKYVWTLLNGHTSHHHCVEEIPFKFDLFDKEKTTAIFKMGLARNGNICYVWQASNQKVIWP